MIWNGVSHRANRPRRHRGSAREPLRISVPPRGDGRQDQRGRASGSSTTIAQSSLDPSPKVPISSGRCAIVHLTCGRAAGLALWAALVASTAACSPSRPAWVGTSTRLSVESVSVCQIPGAFVLHGLVWDSKESVPRSWPQGTGHSGRIHFNSTNTATFTADDGTLLHFTGVHGKFAFPARCTVDGAQR